MVGTKILIDVDGVLNPYTKCNVGYCRCHLGWVRRFGFDEYNRKFKLGLNPAHGRLLRELADDTDGELAWYTTWNKYANYYIGPEVGLPQLPVVPVDRVPPLLAKRFEERGWGWGTWKAQKLAPQAKWPFVWFDDEPDARSEALRVIKVPHLVVTVDAEIGLTAGNVEEARKWLLAQKAA